jgi:hypothetical protein
MGMDFGLIALVVAFGHLIVYAVRSARNQVKVAQALEAVRDLERRVRHLDEQFAVDHDKIVDLEIELNNIR